jgi:hypothetical protein
VTNTNTQWRPPVSDRPTLTLYASVVLETYSEVQQMDIVTSVAVADGPAAELTSKKLLGGA